AGERRGNQRSHSGDSQAAIFPALRDAIAKVSRDEAAGEATGEVNDAASDAGRSYGNSVNAAQKRGEKCADGVHIEIQERAGNDNPPQGGNAKDGPHGAVG